MRKIMTLGLTALTGTVLAFASPVAAHASTLTPYQDSLCAPAAVPASITNLTAQLTNANNIKTAAVTTEALKGTALSLAADALGLGVGNYVHALDNVLGAGTVPVTQAILNANIAAYSAAAADWVNAHNAVVAADNAVSGAQFGLDYVQAVSDNTCP